MNQENKSSGELLILAHVTWLDASAYPGWRGKIDSEPSESLEIQSVGWLIRQNDQVTVLAMSVNEHKIGDLLVIPTQSIVCTHTQLIYDKENDGNHANDT